MVGIFKATGEMKILLKTNFGATGHSILRSLTSLQRLGSVGFLDAVTPTPQLMTSGQVSVQISQNLF